MDRKAGRRSARTSGELKTLKAIKGPAAILDAQDGGAHTRLLAMAAGGCWERTPGGYGAHRRGGAAPWKEETPEGLNPMSATGVK